MAVTVIKDNTSSDLKTDRIVKVLAAQSADETTSDAVDVFGAKVIHLMVVTSAGVNAGVVKLETSIDGSVYYVAGSVTTAAATTAYSAAINEGDAGFPAIYARARIETAIGVGTVDAYIATQS